MMLTFIPAAPLPSSRTASPLASSHHTSPSPPSPHRSPPRRPRTTMCEPRPGAKPAFLPQTIEYAIVEAQCATERALLAGERHVRIELPMGRSRAHWYSMSPINTWYPEASVLAFHYAEMFKGMSISVVLGSGPGVEHNVPWIADVRRLEDARPVCDTDAVPDWSDAEFENEEDMDVDVDKEMARQRVVIFAAVSARQAALLEERLREEESDAQALILFCSFLDTPLDETLPPGHFCETMSFKPFVDTYVCRALRKLAVLKRFHDAAWAAFIEIAVFEYEWVGDRDADDGWSPTQQNVHRFVCYNGARQSKESSYMCTDYSLCEAGFWPFMTACCRNVLPLDGDVLERQAKERKASKAKPFGFF